MATYYIDTCIWRDFAENRTDAVRPLGLFAKRFLLRTVEKGDVIVWSEMLEQESLACPRYAVIKRKIRDFASVRRLVHMPVTAERSREAHELCDERGVPFPDVIHAILARDAGAILITRDADFQKLRDVAFGRAPEEFL